MFTEGTDVTNSQYLNPEQELYEEKTNITKHGDVFQNPFPEFRFLTPWEVAKLVFWEKKAVLPTDPAVLDRNLPYANVSASLEKLHSPDEPHLISWIGHATCLLKIAGVFILTDPHFSDKRKRYRAPGIPLEELDQVDVVLISHNHYDHLDYGSASRIAARFPGVRWIVPSGLRPWMERWVTTLGVTEMSCWEEEEVEFGNGAKLTFTCVPAQHWSMRNPLDRNHSLWSGWVVSGTHKSVYFAGDTGYNGRIFNQIGHHYGPFDLSLIPIGAYEPRQYLKFQHVNPEEAVRIHRETGSRLSVGIHWGTFRMGYEPYMAPKEDLLVELEKAGIAEKEFVTFKHGQTERF